MNRFAPAPTDADLAREIVAGGAGAKQAEAALCERFAPRVRLYGLRHLRDQDRAAELVQRVLLVVLEKLRAGAVREPEKIGSFMLGTARLVTRELMRSGKREAPLEQALTIGVAPTTGASVDRERLAGALEALPERERTVMVATFFHECSSSEIAELLATSEGNVRVIRHRAIERLRATLGEP